MIVIDIRERKQALKELPESEECHRRLIETANGGIWLIDTEARTTFVNPRMAGMLGYEPAEIVGHSVMEFVENQPLHRRTRPAADLGASRARRGRGGAAPARPVGRSE